MSVAGRAAWGLAALVAPLAALYASGLGLFAFGSAFGRPDPLMSGGDLCCLGPDRWMEVYAAVPFAVLTGAGVGALLGLAVHATGRAAGRRPSAGRLAGTAAALAATVTTAAIGLAQAAHAGEGWERADCSGFRFDHEAWRAGAPGEQLRIADAVARCGVLDGATAGRAAQLLGTPREDRRRPPRYLEWRIADDRGVLQLDLDGGRIRGGELS